MNPHLLVPPYTQDAHGHMIGRARQAVLNEEARQLIHGELCGIFTQLGCTEAQAIMLSGDILNAVTAAKSLLLLEKEIYRLIESVQVGIGSRNLIEEIQRGFAGRADLVFEQIRPHIEAVKPGRLIDFGCGDGQVTSQMQALHRHEVFGADVVHYLGNGIDIPFCPIDPKRTDVNIPVERRFFKIGVLTNVLHHDPQHERIIKELTRIVSDRLVIIETIPADESEVSQMVLYFMDWIYNRGLHPNANIPVPGTYRSTANWIKIFGDYGWKRPVHVRHLGRDQKLIPEPHALYVLERN